LIWLFGYLLIWFYQQITKSTNQQKMAAKVKKYVKISNVFVVKKNKKQLF